ncbi:hypothetical protein PRtIB026_A05770 [Pseudomonas sp. RtIB026]|nr:hypothetical protein PRtIB026_A05770 [Pseudomonas sp. RtIB026]
MKDLARVARTAKHCHRLTVDCQELSPLVGWNGAAAQPIAAQGRSYKGAASYLKGWHVS